MRKGNSAGIRSNAWNCPAPLQPQRATTSISKKPGRASVHSANVRNRDLPLQQRPSFGRADAAACHGLLAEWRDLRHKARNNAIARVREITLTNHNSQRWASDISRRGDYTCRRPVRRLLTRRDSLCPRGPELDGRHDKLRQRAAGAPRRTTGGGTARQRDDA